PGPRPRCRGRAKPGCDEPSRLDAPGRKATMNGKNCANGGVARRALLAAGPALPLFAIRTRPADAAEFSYKLATGQDPTRPVNKRSQEAIDRIRDETSGKLEIRLFPANQLGSDTDLLGQVRNGGVEF